MKLNVPYISIPETGNKGYSNFFKNLKKHPIYLAPWGEGDQNPDVKFSIAHSSDAVLIQYVVCEKETRAVFSNHNDPIYRDSCVEFFVRFDGDENYYNFEFNCLGTCLSAYGNGRENRMFLPVDVINKIQTQTAIKRKVIEGQQFINWQLTVFIPTSVFIHNTIETLKGQKASANFYKCGDDLSKPHFLCWNLIETPNPDFHQSSFFGELNFQ